MKAYLMCGLPGSGKSTIADRMAYQQHLQVICPDVIGFSLYEKYGANDKKVFRIAELVAEIQSIYRHDIIIDATNLFAGRRDWWIQRLKRMGYDEIIAVYVECDPMICRERMVARGRVVPEEAFDNMDRYGTIPKVEEGFTSIERVRTDK